MDFAHQFLALNRGLVSPLALARLDLKRMALAADVHTNWMPRVLGPMMLRAGWGYIGSTLSNAPCLNVDFVFGQDDTAMLELTQGNLRVRVNDVIVTRPAITSTFNSWNGSAYIPDSATQSAFQNSGDVAAWHQNDEAGAVSALAGSGSGLQLLGTGTATAIRDRSINVAGANVGKEHALTIVVARGIATLRLGSSEGNDDYLGDRTLRAGTHSIAITPSGTFYVRLSSAMAYAAIVSSVTIMVAGGDMALPIPYQQTDLDFLRWEQSGDVIFVACRGYQQKRIERQDRTSNPPSRSWSIVEYAPMDGPFGTLNTGPVQLSGSALSGEIVLTASKNFFKTTHVGALFRLTSAGQQVQQQITAQNTFTNPIKVTGVGSPGRQFNITLTGPTFTNTTTVTLQRSVATPGNWADVATYTATQSVNIYDNLDNQIIYYRIGVKSGQFTALDNLTAQMTFAAGSINGIVRVTGYTDQRNVAASVLTPLGAAFQNTSNWNEGDWSPRQGYPSAVALFDGRLCWFGKGYNWLSASGLFDSFDDTAQGDSATIRRSMGSGPVDQVNWLLALNFLLAGTAGPILVAKSSSIDQPLTPTLFSQKPVTDVGAAAVRAIKIDSNGVYVGRNGSRVFQLSADANLYSIVPYAPSELTELMPEIGQPGIKRIAVQRHPNTRIHLVRGDGTVVVIVFDKAEQVTCLLLVQTDGAVEDACVLPGPTSNPVEDQVYYTVRRTINGAQVRYVEKWAQETQAVGSSDNRIADCHTVLTGARGQVITGLGYLEGKQVVAWIDGKCPLDTSFNPVLYTVTNGQITLPYAATSFVCIGLPYTAQWRCAKLSVGSHMQAPLTQFKNIDHVGFVLASTHAQGLKYGQTFDVLDSLPLMEDGAAVDTNSIWPSYDKPAVELDGTWDTDARICLQAQAPLPCTVLGIVVSGEGHDKG